MRKAVPHGLLGAKLLSASRAQALGVFLCFLNGLAGIELKVEQKAKTPLMRYFRKKVPRHSQSAKRASEPASGL